MDPAEYNFADVKLPAPNNWPRRLRIRRQVVQGFSIPVLSSILMKARFQVDRRCMDKLAYLFLTGPVHTFLNLRERRLFTEKIEATKLQGPPVFLLGHWRNGTTFLHNLLCQDPNHTFPRNYQTIFSGSFLLGDVRKISDRFADRIPLKKRPMDNVAFGVSDPAEDDFIMASLTGISPYMRIMFPNTMGPEAGYTYPDFRSTREIERWKKAFIHLLKRLSLLENKRIVLKSPPHTARIKVLLELFPEAKFIHIIRNPYDVFPSNLRLWRDAFSLSFLQRVTPDQIVEMVLSTYVQMYERYHTEKSAIPGPNLVEIKFEDLEEDPLGQMRHIYDRLCLPGFDLFAPRVSRYLEGLKGYKKNAFEITPEMKRKIRERWSITFDIYGYNS